MSTRTVLSEIQTHGIRVHEIHTREELIQVLGIAAELEHNLMCQYLFAAYSLKRSTDEGLTEVQVERARRWGSAITMVARQEMEHLGIALNLRSAIGGVPYLSRPNFPQRLDYYGKANIKTELTPFSADTIRRFQEFEKPIGEVPPGWCDMPPEAAREFRRKALRNAPGAPLMAGRTRLQPHPFTFDSVQALYLGIELGFQNVAAKIGEKTLFIGPPDAQIWGGPGSPYEGSMDDLNQYDIDLVPVRNLKTALAAIGIILEQGEGIAAPPDYVKYTHYCQYTQILHELEYDGFDAARPVVANPLTAMHRDITAPDEVHLITNPETLEVAVVFNRTYELMLVMMLFLYGHHHKKPGEAHSFTDAIFFPLMTMFLRPLAEILTELPAFPDPLAGNAGPGFELPNEIVALPNSADLWGFLTERFDELTWDLRHLSLLKPGRTSSAIASRLRYIGDNMERLAKDWRDNWTDVGRTS